MDEGAWIQVVGALMERRWGRERGREEARASERASEREREGEKFIPFLIFYL